MSNIDPGDAGEPQRRRVEFVAHDLNHLAAIILGYSALLLERAPDSGRDRADLEQIHRAAERVAALTQQLRKWKLERPVPESLVNLNTLVREASPLLRGVLGPEVELRAELSPHLGATRAAPEQIDRVFLNLVLNARDAMPDGGVLTILTLNLDLGPAAAAEWGVRPGGYVEIQFLDSGKGMDPAAERAAGLGLPIVREIARQTGGGVKIRSAAGQGTAVSIVLPRVADAGAHPAPGSGSVILVVDDEPQFRALVREMIESGNHRVVEAENGERAAAILARGGVDLMLVDILMPQKDGLEVTRLAHKQYAGLKIIAMSGARDDYLGVAKLLGADAVLGKPFRKELLLEIIRRLLA